MKRKNIDFTIDKLGKEENSIPNPIGLSNSEEPGGIPNYVQDNHRILYDIRVSAASDNDFIDYGAIEKAGPREFIYFHPKHVRAGIICCGGLCPGINDVIRSAVRSFYFDYGVKNVIGIKFGYQGLLEQVNTNQQIIIDLNPENVDVIHRVGGSILGSSRGFGERTEELVDSIEKLNLNILLIIGGDGTQRGALGIKNEISKRGLKVAIVGIPKTVDNDLEFIDYSFGFRSAVEKAVETIFSAHQEANSAVNGIGLVKLMGRDSGFIAAQASLASQEVNFCLIPESKFDLYGENGFLAHLEKRIERRKHAVIVVAEGACQEMMEGEREKDGSGNTKYKDVGIFLKDRINEYFSSKNIEINLKYIDPSYIIRSIKACSYDSVYCTRLASNAVHGVMAGKTGFVSSRLNNRYVYVPTELMTKTRKYIDTKSSLWRDVITNLRMPLSMLNKCEIYQ